jgi:carbonic anhydrase
MELSESSPLEFMEIIYEGLDKIPHPGDNTTLSKPIDIDPVAEVLSDNKTFNYAYIGSLTQPPCTEGVSWVIPTTTFPITICQFNALKKVLRFNSRYTQNTLKDGNLLQIGCGH